MSAFLVVHVNVKDQAKWQSYGQGAPGTLAEYGGELVLRGQAKKVLTGEHGHQMVAIIKFPDQGAVDTWYNSPAYQALIPNRDEAADMVFISYDEPPA